MEETLYLDQYPTYYTEIAKDDCKLATYDDLLAYFKTRIDDDALAGFMGFFDQCGHTRGVGGDVAEHILHAGNVVFCFGQKLPNTRLLAVKPRAIGVADIGDKFAVTFMAAPNDAANATMKSWVMDLVKE